MSRTILFIAASLLLSQTGCVHRRVTINSNPAGALVRIDGKDIGYTPASMDYTWYGTREVQLLKDGYETQTQLIDISAPWYQRFPLDFVAITSWELMSAIIVATTFRCCPNNQTFPPT